MFHVKHPQPVDKDFTGVDNFFKIKINLLDWLGRHYF